MQSFTYFQSAIFVLALIFVGSSYGQSLPKAAKDVIRFECEGAKLAIESSSKGDLNGDGIDDVAVIVKCPADFSQKIIVLLGKSNGTFKIAEESQIWLTHDRRWDKVDLGPDGLSYSQGCAAACNNPWEGEFKFKMRNGRLVLVGEDHKSSYYSYKSPKDGSIEYEYSTQTSINYLSKEVIYSGRKNQKRIEKQLKFNQSSIKFSDFSYDVSTHLAQQLNGYIDENLSLKFPSK
jgi:hypothetical protein